MNLNPLSNIEYEAMEASAIKNLTREQVEQFRNAVFSEVFSTPTKFIHCQELRGKLESAKSADAVAKLSDQLNFTPGQRDQIVTIEDLALQNYMNFAEFVLSHLESLIKDWRYDQVSLSQSDIADQVYESLQSSLCGVLSDLPVDFNTTEEIQEALSKKINSKESLSPLKRLFGASPTKSNWNLSKDLKSILRKSPRKGSKTCHQVLLKNAEVMFAVCCKSHSHLCKYLGFDELLSTTLNLEDNLDRFYDAFDQKLIISFKNLMKVKAKPLFIQIDKIIQQAKFQFVEDAREIERGFQHVESILRKSGQDRRSFNDAIRQLNYCQNIFEASFGSWNTRLYLYQQVRKKLGVVIDGDLYQIFLKDGYEELEVTKNKSSRKFTKNFLQSSQILAENLMVATQDTIQNTQRRGLKLKGGNSSKSEEMEEKKESHLGTKMTAFDFFGERLDNETMVDMAVCLLLIFPQDKNFLFGENRKQEYLAYLTFISSLIRDCFLIDLDLQTFTAPRYQSGGKTGSSLEEDQIHRLQSALKMVGSYQERLKQSSKIDSILGSLRVKFQKNEIISDAVNITSQIIIFYQKISGFAADEDYIFSTNQDPDTTETGVNRLGRRGLFIQFLGFVWPHQGVIRAEHLLTLIESNLYGPLLKSHSCNSLDEKAKKLNDFKKVSLDQVYSVEEANKKVLGVKKSTAKLTTLSGSEIPEDDIEVIESTKVFQYQFLTHKEALKDPNKDESSDQDDDEDGNVESKSLATTLLFSGFFSQNDNLSKK